tara:strand:+ start:606 stop:2531 length:1926 start_codon:yes stop_codon:yes gene_type:complete
MPLVNFSNLDFDQIKTTLKDYLQTNANFTDYDFEGSNLSTVVDLLAYNTYITSYNANMVTNEVFIDSATLRENIVSLARNIGYLPRSRKASRTSVSFFVDTTDIIPSPSIVTLKKGVVATTAGTFGNQSYIFSILEDISVPVFNNIAEFTDIMVYEGNVLNINFTYSLRNPTQKFIVPNAGVDTELISVHVKSNEQSTAKTKYNAHSSLFDISRDSKVYFLQEIEDERYQLLFGDGIFGKKLEEGNFIEADYIVTSGDTGNGVGQLSFSGSLTYGRNGEDYNITSGISLLTTNTFATGGEMIESIDSIRKFAPRIYASQNRAVTAADYESLVPARIYPETESISVFGGEELIPPQYGKVFISIKPRTGDFLPNLIKENIKMRLKKYAVAGIVPEILDLKYLYLEIKSQIYYNSNLARNGAVISGTVQDNGNKYADSSELNKYGARFKYSKFLNIIDQSHEAITSNITTVEMRRDLRLILNKVTEYSIGYGNQFHIRSMSGYNIKSSGFTVEGITNTVYISDIPNTNRITGSLFLFTLPNPNSYSPTIIRRNIGVINYVSGIITLNPIVTTSGKIKDGQSIIELSVCPKSNDVIGLQDLYLQLDIGSSIFEPVVDEIASGADPAGSQYTVSSSYQNGALVRA